MRRRENRYEYLFFMSTRHEQNKHKKSILTPETEDSAEGQKGLLVGS